MTTHSFCKLNYTTILLIYCLLSVVFFQTDGAKKCFKVVLAEDENGVHIRPRSRWVFRTEVNHVVTAQLFVTVFGEEPDPLKPLTINLRPAISILKGKERGPDLSEIVVKADDISSDYTVFIYPGKDPDNVRKVIDGQIYALEYTYSYNKITNKPLEPDRDTAIRSSIFVHVYDSFEIPEKPNWITHVYPIFKQYANLFPVMKDFIDLGNYYSVVQKKCQVQTVMLLGFDDPQFMPVTRDLSPNKTEMILRWLDEEKPVLGKEYPLSFDIETLLRLLQIALQLEHSTIPVYLNGYLSIKPGRNQEVKKILHDIIVDEMFHFAQVANIMNALGGRPSVLGKNFIPSYPCAFPGGVQPGLKVTIDKISHLQIHDVYMEIEEPSHVLEEHGIWAWMESQFPKQGRVQSAQEVCQEVKDHFENFNKKYVTTNHNTIGEVYMTIVYVLAKLTNCGATEIFSNKKRQVEWHDEKRLIKVHDFTTALDAIKLIIDQGEGASPRNPLQAGDNGPLSHYFSFATIFNGWEIKRFNESDGEAEKIEAKLKAACNKKDVHENYIYAGDKIPFYQQGVWPVIKDPKMSKYKYNSRAYRVAKSFNDVYLKLLQSMQNVFDGNVERFDDAFGLMKSLIVYGNRVVKTPIEDDGDPEIGPNAGPTYLN